MNRDKSKTSRLGITGPTIADRADHGTDMCSITDGPIIADRAEHRTDIDSITEKLAAESFANRTDTKADRKEEALKNVKEKIGYLEQKVHSAGITYDAATIRPNIDMLMSKNKKEKRSVLKSITSYKTWLLNTIHLLRHKTHPQSSIDEIQSTDTPYNRQAVERITPMNVKKTIRQHMNKITVEDKNAEIPSTVRIHKIATPTDNRVASEFVVQKIIDGQIWMRHITSWGSMPFYLQTNRYEPFIYEEYGTKGKRVRKCNVCKVCRHNNDTQEFHSKYAHNGGKHCGQCPFVAFTFEQFEEHKPTCNLYRSNSLRLEMDNAQNVVEGNGYSLSRVLAIPLQQQNKTELWIGSTLCSTAMAGARAAVYLMNTAKKHNFTKKGLYCPSLAEMLYPNQSNVLPWKADVANAFFFVGNFGGTLSATDNIHTNMKRVKGKMLQQLSEQDNIPPRHMQYLRDHYLPSNHSHITSSLQFDPFPFLKHNRQKYQFIVNDAQCTASVIMAGVLASLKLTNTRLSDNTILFQGAEEATLAIASFCVMAMKKDGLSEADAARKLWVVDNKGLIVKNRPNGGWNDSFSSYAHKHDPADTLAEAVEQIKLTILVGAAAIGGAFTPAILKRMADFNDRPIIFALSNPTSKAECTAEDAYKYTSGKCVFASGSPFPPVVYNGKTYYPVQCNSSHIFPGVALAVICTGASTIPEEVFLISAEKLAGMVTAADLDKGSLYGRFDNYILQIATTVTKFLYEAGFATVRPAPRDHKALLYRRCHHM